MFFKLNKGSLKRWYRGKTVTLHTARVCSLAPQMVPQFGCPKSDP